MKVLPVNEENIQKAVDVLKQGGIIVYPTETSYGLGGIAFNARVEEKIYKIKERQREKILPVIAESFLMAERFFVLEGIARELAEKYWPGPLTILLFKKETAVNKKQLQEAESLSDGSVRSDCSRLHFKPKHLATATKHMQKDSPPALGTANGKIAVRVSSSRVAQKLSGGILSPVISTSANISGAPSCYNIDDVIKQFDRKKHQPDLLLDAGRLKLNLPSTIVDAADGKAEVIRQGNVYIGRQTLKYS